MRAYLTCALGAAGVVAVAFAPPASADNLNSVVRSLNAVLNPDDARRLEDQSRREGRRDEERYWHNYGAGLEQQRGGRPQYAAPTSADQARRLEEQAHRDGRWEEERYWHNYGAGLEAPRPGYRGDAEPRDRQARIGPEDAYRLEQQARREGHWDEARYWAAYRSGLEGRR
ncbi:MAG TPA: hypothetical protein VFC56_02445 [Stellaceae bacterium]|nr:hypothetical protein [Stellaceae bacterium]